MKEDGTKVYEIWGPLFFGSISAFNEKFDVKNDPDKVEIDFVESRISDHSALEAIFNLVNKYEKAGKKITLKHLSTDCKKIMYKASPNKSWMCMEIMVKRPSLACPAVKEDWRFCHALTRVTTSNARTTQRNALCMCWNPVIMAQR